MNLPEYAVTHRALILFATLLLAVGGIASYSRLGRLEDPEFTIKVALVITPYPGASPEEVEQQVTEVIEKAAQELDDLERVRSLSRAGLSIVYVDIDEALRGPQLRQIWDELRNKVHDAQAALPPGAGPSEVRDDFGDVFGVVLAVCGEGFSPAELKRHADELQRELLLVDDVAKVELWGVQHEVVELEISRARLADLGIPPQWIVDTLQRQNQVVDAGAVDVDRERLRLTPSGTFVAVEEIGDLVLRPPPAPAEAAVSPAAALGAGGDASAGLVRLRDVATIRRGYLDPPPTQMRFNGRRAIGVAVSTVSGGNVVAMGDAVAARIEELSAEFPVGLSVETVFLQGDHVREAIGGFVRSLLQSVTIVVAVLLVTMGLRSGLLIGSSLILSILGTLIVMRLMGVDLQRTSLGAFIIAMGMLVDNAIVVTEGTLIRLQRGERRFDAIVRPAVETAWPLLGATLVAIFAFLPIYLAEDDTGEYCVSLFQVVAVALTISWLLAMTQTPVFCGLFLKPNPATVGRDPYAGRVYQVYRRLLEKALHHRIFTVGVMVVLLVAAAVGFAFLDQIFFPKAARDQFMVDYWLPEGSSIHAVAEDLEAVEAFLLNRPEVVGTATFLGAGPPRFYLPYEPELPNPSYGQVLVNVADNRDVERLIPVVEEYLREHFPQAEPRVRQFILGIPVPFEVEARFSGPDPEILRDLTSQAMAVFRSEPAAKDVRSDWRQRVKTLVPEFSQPRARRALVSRVEMALALRRVSDGLPLGHYREGDELLPIVVRAPAPERADLDNLGNVPVWGQGPQSVPLSQVVNEIRVGFEDPVIVRRNRRRTMTAQCDPVGINAMELLARVRPRVEAIELPPGYRLEWGGEWETSQRAQAMVFSKLPAAFLLMSLVVVALFNAFRQPLIILLVLPLSLIGVTVGLLLTGQPFGFMALLGAMSLFGMLIKNAVVLLDQIDAEVSSGRDPYEAVVHSSVGRMRPVIMASLTTVVGMLPLVFDTLFGAMAITIMFGLSFATVLTLIVVPVLYSAFFRIHPEA